jgi:hypothetical protein
LACRWATGLASKKGDRVRELVAQQTGGETVLEDEFDAEDREVLLTDARDAR